ncbi:MAG: phage terminase large subunit [Pseudomonadota bacterium]
MSRPAVIALPLDLFIAMWNESQGQKTPALHRDIACWLNDRLRDGDPRMLIMAFRGCGKSTLTGLYCAWRLALDHDLRVLVLSADEALAGKMVRNIRRIIERHPLTADLMPTGSKDQWANDRFTIDRAMELRDPSVMARGIEANITGSRADLVICDDVEVPNTAATAEMRERLRERLAEIDFVLTPNGAQLYLGTPHHRDSLYTDQSEAGFLADAKRLVKPIINDNGSSAWPERFPLSAIDQLKRQAGPLRFAAQMMLQPLTIEAGRLNPTQLKRYAKELSYQEAHSRPVLRLDDQRLVSAACWWDPAFGQRSDGDTLTRRAKRDRSVIACVFTGEDGHYWLHRVEYLTIASKDPTDEATQQCRQVAQFLTTYHLPAVHLEINGIGRFLPGLLRQQLHHEGIEAAVVEVTSRKPKDQRIIEAFDAVLAAGALSAHQQVWSTPLIDELTDWRPGISGPARDDGLDAVAGCLSVEPVRFTRPLRKAKPARPRPEWQGG